MTPNNMLYFLNRNNIFFKNKSNIESFWQLVWHMIQVWCASWGIIPVWAIIFIRIIILLWTDSAGRFQNTAVIVIIVSVVVTIIIMIMIIIIQIIITFIVVAMVTTDTGCSIASIFGKSLESLLSRVVSFWHIRYCTTKWKRWRWQWGWRWQRGQRQ